MWRPARRGSSHKGRASTATPACAPPARARRTATSSTLCAWPPRHTGWPTCAALPGCTTRLCSLQTSSSCRPSSVRAPARPPAPCAAASLGGRPHAQGSRPALARQNPKAHCVCARYCSGAPRGDERAQHGQHTVGVCQDGVQPRRGVHAGTLRHTVLCHAAQPLRPALPGPWHRCHALTCARAHARLAWPGLQAMAQELLPKLNSGTAQNVVNILWSYATLSEPRSATHSAQPTLHRGGFALTARPACSEDAMARAACRPE